MDPLLDLLAEIRALRLPDDPVFGATTANIGVLEAGTAPNVIADRARAEILFRTGRPVATLAARLETMCAGRADLEIAYRSDPIAFRVPRSRPSEIVSFACDLPLLPAWGEPLLVGPGSISDAHATEERVELAEVERAVGIYRDLVRALLDRGEDGLAPARSH